MVKRHLLEHRRLKTTSCGIPRLFLGSKQVVVSVIEEAPVGRLGTWEARGGAGTGFHPSCLDLRFPGATFRTLPLLLLFGHSGNMRQLTCLLH